MSETALRGDASLRVLERAYASEPSIRNGVALLRAYERVGDRKSHLRLRAKLGYVAETSVLPLPTEAQTAAFVNYVASAHSWYKHLPREHGVPFVFALDPHVMMTTKDGRHWKEAVTREDLGVGHYSSMPTSVYREKFGFWIFLSGRVKSNDPSEYCRSIMTTPQLKITSQSGHKVKIPADLIATGTAWLTAWVYGHAESIVESAPPHEVERHMKMTGEHRMMLKAMRGFLAELKRQQVDLGLRSV